MKRLQFVGACVDLLVQYDISKNWSLDTRKAEIELGYLPRPIDGALTDAIAWLTRRDADAAQPRFSA